MIKRRFILALLLPIALAACGTTTSTKASIQGAPSMTTSLEQVKQRLAGDWASLATEIRPSAQKNPDGTLKPFYLKRDFSYLAGDRFELVVTNFADPNGKVALARIAIKGHMVWEGEHPIAPGAQKVNFLADEAYAVTPLV